MIRRSQKSTGRPDWARPNRCRTRSNRTLAISKVHWSKPEVVAEITCLTWARKLCWGTQSLSGCEDMPVREVGREIPAKI